MSEPPAEPKVRPNPFDFGNPWVHQRGLKILPVWVRPPLGAPASHHPGIFLALNLLCMETTRNSGGTTKGETSYAQFKPCFRTGV